MRFKVEGVDYEFPAVDSLTMDETILLERYAGQTVEAFLPGESLPMGAVKALIVIGIMRQKPDESERSIAEAIGKIKLADLGTLMEQEDEAGGAGPPSASNGNDESTRISGTDGKPGSAPSPEVLPLRSTGLPASDTGATSAPGTSAA
jgi:hypothetical protein